MKTFGNSGFRNLVVSMLFAAGIATTIATGGGGSGGSVTPPPPPPSSQPMAITALNAHDVSSTLVVAIGMSLDIGDLADNELPVSGAAGSPMLLKLMRADDLAGKPLPNGAAKLENCDVDGTRDITATLADPNTLTVNDRIVGIFVDCDNGDGYAISGTVDLTVAAIEGDLSTGVFLLRFAVLMTDVVISDGSDLLGADGDFDLTLDTLDFPVISQTIGGWELILESGPESVQFAGFEHYIEVDTGVSPETALVTVSGRLDSQLLGGYFDYETPVPVRLVGDDEPYTGEILITGDDSTVRIVINDSTSVTLEVDTNGDGVVDNYIATNFAALNGHGATVNSSTAPVIAHEVINAVAGFGSLSIAPPSQFMAAGPFGQIKLQSVSGEFGPVQVDCSAGGTAAVSGNVAAAGTFSENDQLSAALTGCARGGEVLNGNLDFTVGNYSELAGDAYHVTGTAVETMFNRVAGGNEYEGYGEIEVNYDYRFTSPGFAYANCAAQAFDLAYDDADHYLTNATVNAEIALGPPPVTVSRFSTGTVIVFSLAGDFSYESVIADVFVLDNDPATGPYSGELLVTADDGSTLRIVAIDELNVRLDIDENGDGMVDNQLLRTWAALQ